jgi:lipid II:glycine glycyltransferase (peptidoglycan interpeptide bridge formation enzyme)
VWAGRFTGAARRYVRIAERSGLVVERGAEPAQLDAFYELYLRSVERWAQAAGPAPARWWTAHRREARRKFDLAAAALGDDFVVWTAATTEGPVAAIIVLHHGEAASYWRGAMVEAEAGRTRANYLLHRLAIEEACLAGCRTYHMGETGDSASLAQFKTRFGACALAYTEYRLERLPLTPIASRARSLAEAGLRLLGPRGGSQTGGPHPRHGKSRTGQP